MGLTITDHRFPYYPSREITANLGRGLRGMFRKGDDNIFSFLLEHEFSRDLEFATRLTFIPEEKINNPIIKHQQQMALSSLREKYYPEGKCSSHLFPFVSRKLQEEYRVIHNKICEVLYPPSITFPQQSLKSS